MVAADQADAVCRIVSLGIEDDDGVLVSCSFLGQIRRRSELALLVQIGFHGETGGVVGGKSEGREDTVIDQSVREERLIGCFWASHRVGRSHFSAL